MNKNNYELMEVLKDYLKTNTKEMVEVVKEINYYDESLGWLYFIDMEVFDEYCCKQTIGWLAKRIYHGEFNPNHKYIRFNEYGNIVSYSMNEVIEECTNYINDIVDRLMELYPCLKLNNNIENIFKKSLDL